MKKEYKIFLFFHNKNGILIPIIFSKEVRNLKKTNAMMLGAAMLIGGYGIYKYYTSHSNEIKGCVKDTMKKVKDSMKQIDEDMM